MQITVTYAIGGDVKSVPIDIHSGDMIRSLIVQFCYRMDIPAPDSQQMKNEQGMILDKDSSFGEAGIHNGDAVYISQTESAIEHAEDGHRIKVKRVPDREGAISVVLMVAGFVFVTGSIIGIIVLSMKFSNEICTDKGYGAIFDAGSTHTNLTVYSWLGDLRVGETGVVTQQGTCRVPGGGISSYTDNPQEAGLSLKSCLDETQDIVKEMYYNQTSLHLGATAGMRLLRETQPATSAAILESVQTTMASYPFNFSADQATIISGSNEGTYGWVSTNFLAGTLNSDASFWTKYTSAFFGDPPPTYGALDLGGASTQITFVPEDPSSMPPEYTVHLRLYGVDYKLYTHSYLCYGVNEAIRRFKANLVTDSGGRETTLNPCAPKGFSEVVDDDYLWKAPCSMGPQALAGWGSEVTPPPSAENATTFNLTGTSDVAGCKAAVQKLVNVDAPCSFKPCSFNGIYQPEPYGKFMAFSVFDLIIAALGLPSNASIEAINNKTQSFCAKTYDELKKMTGDIQLIVLYCFEINYLSTLLFEGYHFNDDNWNMTFTNEASVN